MRAPSPGSIERGEKKRSAGEITGGNAEGCENKRLAKIATQNLLEINGLKIDDRTRKKDNAETQSTRSIAEVLHTPGVLRKEFGFA